VHDRLRPGLIDLGNGHVENVNVNQPKQIQIDIYCYQVDFDFLRDVILHFFFLLQVDQMTTFDFSARYDVILHFFFFLQVDQIAAFNLLRDVISHFFLPTSRSDNYF
jgi:hypothetical protein